MNKGIAHILMDKLKDIPFIQKFGGLVYTQEQEDIISGYEHAGVMTADRKIFKRFPVTDDYCITKTECNKPAANDFTPDSSYYGQTYFEDNGIEPLGRDGKRWKYKSKLRLVVWLNTRMIVTADTFETLPGHSISTAVFAAIQERLSTLDNSNSGFYQRLKVKERGMPIQDKNVFSAYTFDTAATQYLMAPYEFFAVDYEVEFLVNPECITDLAVSLDDLPCNCEESVPVPVQYPCLNDLLPYTVDLRIGVDTNTGTLIKPNAGVTNQFDVEFKIDEVVIIAVHLGNVFYPAVPLNEDGDSLDFSTSAGEVVEGILSITARKKIV